MTTRIEKLVEETKAFHDEVHDEYVRHFDQMIDYVQACRDPNTPTPDLVDVGFMLRQAAKFFEDLRKEADAKQRLIGQIIALRVIRESMIDEDANYVVRGQYARGECDSKPVPKLPFPGTEEYARLCDWIGVPEHLRAKSKDERSPMKLDFKGLQALVHERLSAGEDPPEGLELQSMQAFTKYVKRNW